MGVGVLTIPNLILKAQCVDEDYWICGASLFLNGEIPWKSVSTFTGGPLTYIGVSLMYFLVGELNYASIRLFNLFFCIYPAIIFVYLTFKFSFKKELAFILIVPMIMLFAYVKSSALIAYASEFPPMMLSAISMWIFIKIQKKKKILQLVLLGFILGLFPYTKLQSVPIGLTIALCSFIEIIISKTHLLKNKLTSSFFLILGGILPSLICYIYLFYNNALLDFWADNILFNLSYTKEEITSKVKFFDIYLMALQMPELWVMIYCFCVLCFLSLFILHLNKKKIVSSELKILIYLFIIFLSSLISVALHGRFFGHYQTLAIVPFIIFAGHLIGITIPVAISNHTKNQILIFLLLAFIPLSLLWFRGNQGIDFVNKKGNYSLSPIAKEILLYGKPNETLTSWGWGIEYNVETGLIPGIKPMTCWYEIRDTNKIANPYLDSYISNITAYRPIIFIDAVGPHSFMYNNRMRQGHENFYLLDNFIEENYKLVSEIDSVRIYVLNNRYNQIKM